MMWQFRFSVNIEASAAVTVKLTQPAWQVRNCCDDFCIINTVHTSSLINADELQHGTRGKQVHFTLLHSMTQAYFGWTRTWCRQEEPFWMLISSLVPMCKPLQPVHSYTSTYFWIYWKDVINVCVWGRGGGWTWDPQLKTETDRIHVRFCPQKLSVT